MVYAGKVDDFDRKGHATKVVLDLMYEKFADRHALHMGNFYNSYGK